MTPVSDDLLRKSAALETMSAGRQLEGSGERYPSRWCCGRFAQARPEQHSRPSASPKSATSTARGEGHSTQRWEDCPRRTQRRKAVGSALRLKKLSTLSYSAATERRRPIELWGSKNRSIQGLELERPSGWWSTEICIRAGLLEVFRGRFALPRNSQSSSGSYPNTYSPTLSFSGRSGAFAAKQVYVRGKTPKRAPSVNIR